MGSSRQAWVCHLRLGKHKKLQGFAGAALGGPNCITCGVGIHRDLKEAPGLSRADLGCWRACSGSFMWRAALNGHLHVGLPWMPSSSAKLAKSIHHVQHVLPRRQGLQPDIGAAGHLHSLCCRKWQLWSMTRAT